jgi:DTW domain-containing protein YfiP
VSNIVIVLKTPQAPCNMMQQATDCWNAEDWNICIVDAESLTSILLLMMDADPASETNTTKIMDNVQHNFTINAVF